MNDVIEIARISVIVKNPKKFLLLSKNIFFRKYFLKRSKGINLKSAISLRTSFVRLDLSSTKINNNTHKKIRRLFPSSYPFLKEFDRVGLRDRWLSRFLQVPRVKKIIKENLDNKGDKKLDIILGNYYLFINNHAKNKGALFMYNRGPQDKHWYLFSIALKGVFRSILKKHDGIIIHASALKKANHAFIFVGSSGKGKSTICKLLRDWPIFSDDAVVVRRNNGVFKAFSTPWNNEDCESKRLVPARKACPVKAIFFLEKSDDTRLERISLKDALTKLLYEDMPFQQSTLFDTKGGLSLFTFFCMDLLKNVSLFRLLFKNDSSFKKKFTCLLKKEQLL